MLFRSIAAIGNHHENDGDPVNPVAAAVILADKSDVHRTRVRNSEMIKFDIHDRVNYAVEKSFLNVDDDRKHITLELTLVSASTCAPLAGRAVYVWHCDRLGRYSLYSAGATTQNYLRGVQEADANGKVTFTTIYPGCYAGRWPHIHFEVYPNLAAATSVSNRTATSQIAMQKTTSDLVYATSAYASSVANAAQVTLASDNVFSDGASLELPAMSGSVAGGLTAALTVAV